MGVKISSLPINDLPYTGSEKIPLVQSGVTKAGTLSSFVNYLSGDFAVKNADNNFTNTQTISVIDTTRIKFGPDVNISIGDNANSLGVSNIIIGSQLLPSTSDTVFLENDTNNIAIGEEVNISHDITVTLGNNINIGKGSSITAPTSVENNIAIGINSTIGGTAGFTTSNIAIGAGSSASGGANVSIGAGSFIANDSSGSVVIGQGASSGFDQCIVFGYEAASTTNNQLALGGLIVNTVGGSAVLDRYLTIRIDATDYYLFLSTQNPSV